MKICLDGDKSFEWLLQHGGATILNRATREILGKEIGSDRDLLASPHVVHALGKVGLPGGMFSFCGHHSLESFHNISWKLYQYGLRAGMQPLDMKMKPFREWLAANQTVRPTDGGQLLQLEACKSHCALGLLRLGYYDTCALALAKECIERSYNFAKQNRYDLLVPNTSVPDLPKAFRKHPVLNFDLVQNHSRPPEFFLLCMLPFVPREYMDRACARQIAVVLNYMSKPEYAPRRTIYLRASKGHYYVGGFGLGLPALHESADERCRIVLFAYHLAQLKQFGKSTWLQNAVEHLHAFLTPHNTWRFPAEYIPEKKNGYWDRGGSYMGLGEDRRKRVSLETESTFYMLSILHSMDRSAR